MNTRNKNNVQDDHQWIITNENYTIPDFNYSSKRQNDKYGKSAQNLNYEKIGYFRPIENICRLIGKKLLIVLMILIILLIFFINSNSDSEKISVGYHRSVDIKIKESDTMTTPYFVYDYDDYDDYDNYEDTKLNMKKESNKKLNRPAKKKSKNKIPPKPKRKITRTTKNSNTKNSNTKNSSEFLVWSSHCKIPNFDPYDPQVMKYFTKQKYESCSSEKPLTNVQFNSTTKQYSLNINEKLKKKYGTTLDCCYQAIVRNQKGENADNEIHLIECLAFNQTIQISNTTDNILVKCKNNKKQVYINGHSMMPERAEIRERLNYWKANETKKAPSILMIGIDSVSRLNLLRAMPKTAQKLSANEWFEMSGFNKVDDNTFPNLMAVLTGYNLTTVNALCNPEAFHKLDNCPMIWKLFQDHGYITAYAEDEVSISTFNYLNFGFEVPPVDYYLRPFMIAAEENLKIRIKNHLKFCMGYQHAADYVFDYALELATRYKSEPFFGLFWANTFSHNDISDCSSMDKKMVDYLEALSTRGILKESVVIFFSDHGIRFGPSRFTLSGYFEERLPFMFISLPQWLKTKYPEFVTALNINKNRLTNPYDIHMTLKNLLDLSGRTATDLPNAQDCPNCQSLLKPVPDNRSCEDIGITDHWCTCVAYQSIDTKSDLIHKLAIFAVDYINEYVQNFKNGSISKLCGKIQLNNIHQAYIQKDLEEYRLLLSTKPGGAVFEVTIRHKSLTEDFEIIGSISRLNSYAKDSKCIAYRDAKKYCHCLKKKQKIAN